jgi:hypothetical protein
MLTLYEHPFALYCQKVLIARVDRATLGRTGNSSRCRGRRTSTATTSDYV